MFWDVNPRMVNPSEKPYFVIQRLLDWNRFPAARWVLKTFPKEQIIDSLKTMRGWDKRSANFWANYLNFDRKELMCNQQPFQPLPETPWTN